MRIFGKSPFAVGQWGPQSRSLFGGVRGYEPGRNLIRSRNEASLSRALLPLFESLVVRNKARTERVHFLRYVHYNNNEEEAIIVEKLQ